MEKSQEKKKTSGLTEEQKAALIKSKAEHEHKMATDPEYKAKWEERHKKLEKYWAAVSPALTAAQSFCLVMC